MHINRIQVEEGFLDGFDVTFSEGLNVLIGGRGVGKSSVVELIRFGLGLEKDTDTSIKKECLRHALGVLVSGQVSLTLKTTKNTINVDRSTTDEEPRGRLPADLPIILSQREVELLGESPQGRLSLIDSFLKDNLVDASSEIKKLSTSINSLSVEIRSLYGEIDELSESIKSMPELKKQEKELKKEEAKVSKESKEIQKLQKELNSIQQKLNKHIEKEEYFKEAREKMLTYAEDLSEIVKYDYSFEDWPFEEKISPLEKIKNDFEADFKSLKILKINSDKYLSQIDGLIEGVNKQKQPLENQSRELRQKIELHEKGAGKIARELSLLSESLVRLETKQKTKANKEKKLDECHKRRMSLLQQLEAKREDKFKKRKDVAESLTSSLKPKIKIDINHLAEYSSYEEAIRDVLKGSNLRYNEIAPIIAKTISPIELADLSHNINYKELSEILEISVDRSARLIAAFRDGNIEQILTAHIEDDANYLLLDGNDFKSIEHLSIGQRCTVVLSVVLKNLDRILIIDQPEDHLDNEFIADTLIKAIIDRKGKAQTILTSHNANIPVLGDASNVIHLESNGTQGFVKTQGPLKKKEIVSAIESVMEGGAEAFEYRAKYYNNQ